MQWNDGKNAGFTEGTPWIEVNSDYKNINAAKELEDADSVFHYYKKLIQLRKDYDVIAYGEIEPLAELHPSVFAYKREYQGESLLVISNFYGKETRWDAEVDLTDYQCILSNYKEHSFTAEGCDLKPY